MARNGAGLRRGMKGWVLPAVVGAALLGLSPAIAVAERLPDMYTYLMRTDEAFAATEEAYAKASEAFLARFAAASKPLAEAFLSSLDSLPGEKEYLEAEPGGRFRLRLARDRDFALRYMAAFARRKPFSAGWLALLRPVALMGGGAVKAGAESLLHGMEGGSGLPNDARTVTRRVNGEEWAALLAPDIPLWRAGSSTSSCIAAVVRVRGGKIDIMRIAAPGERDFYPSGREAGAMPAKWMGPDTMTVVRGRLSVRAGVANREGPFALRVETVQVWDDPVVTTLVTSEVASFPYVYRDGVYERGEPSLRPAGAWGDAYPYDGADLIPVRAMRKRLLESDPALGAALDESAKAWSRFLDLFEPETGAVIRHIRREWELAEQGSFLPLLENPAACKERLLQTGGIFARYAARAVALAASPDARLVFLLEPALCGPLRPDRKGRSLYPSPWDSYSAALERALGSLEKGEILLPPMPWTRELHARAEGLEGGGTITVALRAGGDNPFTERAAYTLQTAPDGTAWGLLSRDMANESGDPLFSERDILLARNGRLAFLPLDAAGLDKDAFFRSGRENWPATSDKPQEYWYGCSMLPLFSVDTAAAPFTVRAEYAQVDRDLRNHWECIPECRIPYVWDGSRYVPGQPECLSEGLWGRFEPGARRVTGFPAGRETGS